MKEGNHDASIVAQEENVELGVKKWKMEWKIKSVQWRMRVSGTTWHVELQVLKNVMKC